MSDEGIREDEQTSRRRQIKLPFKLNRGDGPHPGEGTWSLLRVAAVAVVVVLVLGAVWLFFQRSGLSGGDTVGPAPVEDRELTLTDAQTVYADLGPWSDSAIVDGVEQPRQQDTVLWLGLDGSIQESELRMPSIEMDWRASRPPFITNLGTAGPLAVLVIDQRFEYTVYQGQPFVYASHPETAYLVDIESAEIMAVDTNTLLQAIRAGS